MCVRCVCEVRVCDASQQGRQNCPLSYVFANEQGVSVGLL